MCFRRRHWTAGRGDLHTCARALGPFGVCVGANKRRTGVLTVKRKLYFYPLPLVRSADVRIRVTRNLERIPEAVWSNARGGPLGERTITRRRYIITFSPSRLATANSLFAKLAPLDQRRRHFFMFSVLKSIYAFDERIGRTGSTRKTPECSGK